MKKVLSIILTVMMVVGMIPMWSVAVSAEDHVHVDADKNNICDDCEAKLYVDRTWDETAGKVVETLKAIPADAIAVDANTRVLEAGKTYYVSGELTIAADFTVNGTSDKPSVLILADGCNLLIKALVVKSPYVLFIYGQAKDSGVLKCNGRAFTAAIGGGDSGNCGIITINGGTIKPTGGSYSAAIGGGDYGAGGTITINGGIITAAGGKKGTVIGAGRSGTIGKVTVNGGTVTATANTTSDKSISAVLTVNGAYVINTSSAAAESNTTLEDFNTAPTSYVYIHVHAYSTTYVDNEDGTHSLVCSCGAKLTEEHTFVNGVCVCGAVAHVHSYTLEVADDKFQKTPATYTTPAEYYKSCTCGETDIEVAGTFTGSTLALSKCYEKSYCETGSQIGRQGKIEEGGSISIEEGRTIIPLTAAQLEKIGDSLTVLFADGSGVDCGNEYAITVDSVYTYFYDVTNGTETKYEAGQGILADFAALIIIDNNGEDGAVTGYGYFRVYNGEVDEENFLLDALCEPAEIFE